jgi:hypothetical protein
MATLHSNWITLGATGALLALALVLAACDETNGRSL